jgi:hypothetical protein
MNKGEAAEQIQRLAAAMNTDMGRIALDAWVDLVQGTNCTPGTLADAVDSLIAEQTRLPSPAELKKAIAKHKPRRLYHEQLAGLPRRDDRLWKLGREANRLVGQGYRVLWRGSNGREQVLSPGDDDRTTKVCVAQTGEILDLNTPGELTPNPARMRPPVGRSDPRGHRHVRGVPALETCVPCWRLALWNRVDAIERDNDRHKPRPVQGEAF